MDRYSEKAIEINDTEVHTECTYSCYSDIADALQILQAYEDTGLTPEEIEQLMRRCHTAIELWTNTSSKFCKMYDEIEYWKAQSISDKAQLRELRIWLHDNDLDMDDILRKVTK